ncbi:hypothetical protein CPB84DRAFT_1770452 [Gymnopilus junonius]|uniref:Uncharacterized protein n=1 Tax=Gymnopilus junonius TaxID=109634 RepID=A0A9P5NVX1_GYMJU|nr:hypothetical protein CPB84DRAFT_1770452 [Gymnopilus junonius]
MSSPALHLSSAALPSPKSQSAVPASSSSNADVLVSPSRPRPRKPSLQISTPGQDSPSRHRSTQSYTPIPPSPSSPSLHHPPLRDPPRLARTPSSATAKPKPTLTPRAASPTAIRPRSPSSAAATRARVVTPTRGFTSASTSHLPLSSASPNPSTRRTSLDAPRRPSVDGTPRRSSRDGPLPLATSPTQRSYAQNRHFNISSGSLVPSNATPVAPSATSKPNTSPSKILKNPDATPRDLIRAATSLICKEAQKPPPHMYWEEVEVRTKNLVRLERSWSNATATGGLSSARRSSIDVSTSGVAASEDRERKVFCESLKDGYVLCQCVQPFSCHFFFF